MSDGLGALLLILIGLSLLIIIPFDNKASE